MGYVENLRKTVGHTAINLVATTVVVVNEPGEILLQRRTEPYGAWGLPGGLIELGESTELAGKREVFEETGLILDNLQLLGVYSGDKEHHITFKNKDEYYVILIAYVCHNFVGTLMPDLNETLECQFFNPNELPSHLLKRHQVIITDYLKTV